MGEKDGAMCIHGAFLFFNGNDDDRLQGLSRLAFLVLRLPEVSLQTFQKYHRLASFPNDKKV